MIVTKNMFVGYSIISGTVGLQIALLVISLYCVFSYPSITTELELTGEVAQYF